MELVGSVALVLWTALLAPLLYCLYHLVTFLMDQRRRALVIDRYPHDPKHWLWGHLHKVSGAALGSLALGEWCSHGATCTR